MRILFTASEAYPLIKTGGLGDVAGALPPALARQGMDVRLLLPGYPAALAAAETPDNARAMRLGDLMGTGEATLVERRMPDTGLPVWLVDCPPLYDREGGPYIAPDGWDHHDNFQRFALLSRVAALIGQTGAFDGWLPDVVHANDWQTGLLPVMLFEQYQFGGMETQRVCHTIHNFSHQGLTGEEVLWATGLGNPAYYLDRAKLGDDVLPGAVNPLKGAIVYSNYVGTVSPTHAWEARHTDQGEGLQQILNEHHEKFGGILNGLDYDTWNPEWDPHIAEPYSAERIDSKFANKAALRDRLMLNDDYAPIIAYVGRLDRQKGVHLIQHAIHYSLAEGAQFVLLGAAPDPDTHGEFERIKAEQNDNPECHLELGFSEELAHLIYAGADMVVVPSMFEPCGLAQLIGMRYGTVPVVRAVGGLNDTVFDHDFSPRPPEERTGFVFEGGDPMGLETALHRAIRVWYDHPEGFRALMVNDMRQDYSWNHPGQHYMNVYEFIRHK